MLLKYVSPRRTFHTDSYILHRREGGRGKAKTERRWEEKWRRRSKCERSIEAIDIEKQNESDIRPRKCDPSEDERKDGGYEKPFRDSNLVGFERERGGLTSRKCRQSRSRQILSSSSPPPLTQPRSDDLSPPPRVPPRPSDDLPQRRGGGARRNEMVKEVEDKEEGMEQAKEMAKRLQVRVLKLEEELREARRRVEVSQEEGRRMRKRVGGKEGEKLEEQGKEVANVTLLLLGLTRRLAKLEVEGHEGVVGGKMEEERRRRKRRLQEQVEEAKQLRNNVARRSVKVLSPKANIS